MTPLRALRCTFNAPNVTRRPASAVSVFQTPIRLNSSSATATAEEQDEDKDVDFAYVALSKRQLRKRKNRSPQLDEVFGKAQTTKAKSLAKDIRSSGRELNDIYSRQRAYRDTLKGPSKVRTIATYAPQTDKVVMRGNKVTVAEKGIPNIWLRDNCQCSSCMHDATKQRLVDTFSISKDIAIKSHSLDDNMLKIEWSDGHKSEYSQDFLVDTTRSEESKAVLRQGLVNIAFWDPTISSNPPTVDYQDTRGKNIHRVLKIIRRYGFCYVDNTPFETPDATEKLLKRVSFIRETHYGGFYDFTADLASKDTAYTNIALEAHTDNTYFSDPAGLQAFHLLSHTDGEGGASLLVDGFNVADQLRQTDPKAYEVLSTVNVHAHASGNEGISIQPYRSFPVLEHDPATGDLLRIRWNSSDRASIELPIDQVGTWYDAARKFDALLKKQENEYWEQLKPGRVLIFDNWRVLHGRSKFTGKRRICGGYINRDDWISKFKMLQWGPEKVLGGLASS